MEKKIWHDATDEVPILSYSGETGEEENVRVIFIIKTEDDEEHLVWHNGHYGKICNDQGCRLNTECDTEIIASDVNKSMFYEVFDFDNIHKFIFERDRVVRWAYIDDAFDQWIIEKSKKGPALENYRI